MMVQDALELCRRCVGASAKWDFPEIRVELRHNDVFARTSHSMCLHSPVHTTAYSFMWIMGDPYFLRLRQLTVRGRYGYAVRC